MVRLTINGDDYSFDGDLNMPLLWFLREVARFKGVKFGCGIGQCGACTVHMDGAATRSCVMPMAAVEGAAITTIEGLAGNDALHDVQQAWIEEDVAQCGYCQAGQIMAAADFLERFPDPSDDDIDANLTNICRCGTYYRLRKAIHRVAALRNGRAE